MGKSNDSIYLLMQEVVLTCIKDYLDGKISKTEVLGWLDDTESICFIAECLEMQSADLREYVEKKLVDADNQLAAVITLAI